MIAIAIIWSAMVGCFFGFLVGYHAGKRTLFSILDDHMVRGMTGAAAINYERDVMNGKVPKW